MKLDALEPGDLVFFETQGDEVSHVGIAIGGDQFVHAPNSRGHGPHQPAHLRLLGRARRRRAVGWSSCRTDTHCAIRAILSP